MFLIREAGPRDFIGVFRLARILDSYNLPGDRRYVADLLERSAASFRGRLSRTEARYLFVLEAVPGTRRAPAGGGIVGCSLIIAKHGTPGHPHLWFAQETVTKRSRTLGIEKSHPVLRMGWTEDGPTEVGGLVVLPRWRGVPEQCGLQLSYARFLYMAMHPERFEGEILVEYRGAMGKGNRSPFWEAVGRVFTGLTYERADRLSVTNKEFILGLMPSEPIYCALLPRGVQAAIGAIHPSARGAARLAESIGFRRLPQIEPFDGGPYYSARQRDVRLLQRTRRMRAYPSGTARPAARGGRWLAGTERGGRFRAVLAGGRLSGERWLMERQGFESLDIEPGDRIYACSISR